MTRIGATFLVVGVAGLAVSFWWAWRNVGRPGALWFLETGDDAITFEVDTFGDDRPSSFSDHLWREFDRAGKPYNHESQGL